MVNFPLPAVNLSSICRLLSGLAARFQNVDLCVTGFVNCPRMIFIFFTAAYTCHMLMILLPKGPSFC